MTAVLEPGFADDPLANHSAQFPLGQLRERAAGDVRSEPGVRPWGLRWMEEGRVAGAEAPQGTYNPVTQVSVDTEGRPMTPFAATANSVSNQDGDEGASEDWTYDFTPDNPYQV